MLLKEALVITQAQSIVSIDRLVSKGVARKLRLTSGSDFSDPHPVERRHEPRLLLVGQAAVAELTPGSSAPGPDLAVLSEEEAMLFAARDVSHLQVEQ